MSNTMSEILDTYGLACVEVLRKSYRQEVTPEEVEATVSEAYKVAEQQLQALMLKERKDELREHVFGADAGVIRARIKDLDTQIEQLQGKHE